ncbi:MAG: hypothetical protein NT091_02730, partial [Candidatus Falkowbacteria bacterium]|nr:hypothetical protein [Candidatus Falkowbacteria bacterium]
RASIGPNASVMHFNQNGDTRLGIGPSAEIAYNDVALVSAGARFDKDGIDRFATVDLYGLYKAAKREQIKKQPTVN